MKKYVIFLIIIVLILMSAVYAKNTREGIAKNVIRLHILANSDSAEDQALKLKVRDELLQKYKPQLSGSDTIDSTRQLLYDDLTDIKRTAEEVIRQNGYDYSVNVYMAKDIFPTKKYADITLPAGKYEALRIEIGKAGGKNWWCVMFPPLCYADTGDDQTAAKSKQRLEQLLTGDQYCLVTKNTPGVKLKLKLVEIWSGIKEGL